jgi:hypothetical protein
MTSKAKKKIKELVNHIQTVEQIHTITNNSLFRDDSSTWGSSTTSTNQSFRRKQSTLKKKSSGLNDSFRLDTPRMMQTSSESSKRLSLQTSIPKFDFDSDDEDEDIEAFVMDDTNIIDLQKTSGHQIFDVIQHCTIDELKAILNQEKQIDANEHYRNKKHNDATVMHMAARYGRSDIILLLLNEYNAKIDCIDQSESTPLFYAAAHGHAKVSTLIMMFTM